MTEQQKNFLCLIKSALNGKKAELKSNFNPRDAVDLAKKHQLVPIIYYGLKNSEIMLDPELESELDTFIYKSTVIDSNQIYESEELKQIFGAESIDFAILKGLHLKNYFPNSVMRSMSDFDILIRSSQIETAEKLIKARGYKFVTETDHVVEWSKNNYFCLELHKKLIPKNEIFGKYYTDSWKYFQRVNSNSNEWEMSPSDEYIFIFLHFVKHYISGGVGIRQMLDLWIFSEKEKDIDYSYIKGELEALGLIEFWENIRNTLDCWMNNAGSNEKIDFITTVIFKNGIFGTRKNYLIATAVKSNESPDNAGMQRIIKLFFLPYSGMCIKYPILKKHPILLPFYWTKRWLTALFFRRKKGVAHLKEFSEMSGEEIRATKLSYEFVGLNFNFKE